MQLRLLTSVTDSKTGQTTKVGEIMDIDDERGQWLLDNGHAEKVTAREAKAATRAEEGG